MPVPARTLLVAHCDWSTDPRKQWVALARAEAGARFIVEAPELAGDATTLVDRLRGRAGGAGVFLGFDFPIGLPRAYAELAGVDAFRGFLGRLAGRRDPELFSVAASPGDISVDRPFYPSAPGAARHQHQLDALGVEAMDDLRRVCERQSARRRAAAPLFWLVGAAQVGRAAIAGWRDVLLPVLRDQSGVGMWPFDGDLETLLPTCEIVLAETYPAEFYGHLDARPGPGGKTAHRGREPACAALARGADALGVTLTGDARAALTSGFGDERDSEDRFDAFVGLLGMLNVLLGHREAGPPPTLDPGIVAVEGWILGQG